MIDYHIHTLLCNHARGTIDRYVDAAIQAGLEEICFLEHLSFDPNFSDHAMHMKEVPFYVYAVDMLKHKYRGRITIRTGLEIDFQPDAIPAIQRFVQTFDFDLIGGSVHFVDGVNIASRRSAAALTDDAFLNISRRYVKTVHAMLDTPFFDTVCHLDVIKKTNRPLAPDVVDGLKKAIDRIAEKDLALEVNSGGLAHPVKACYPSDALLAHAITRGVAFTTGSDAHAPQGVGAGLTSATDTLKALGATHICRYISRKRSLVPIAQMTQENPC